jgi:hypothetical protein
MSKVVELRRLSRDERFREQLYCAVAILRQHLDAEIDEDVVGAVADLGDDLRKAVREWKGN